MKNDTKSVGQLSEAKVMTRFLELGYTVLIPWGDNARYDLCIDSGTVISRIQVKTGRLRDGVIKFDTCSNGNGYHKQDYKGDIDFFVIYCPETDECYIIGVNEVGSVGCYLRVNPPKMLNKTIRFAEDYILAA